MKRGAVDKEKKVRGRKKRVTKRKKWTNKSTLRWRWTRSEVKERMHAKKGKRSRRRWPGKTIKTGEEARGKQGEQQRWETGFLSKKKPRRCWFRWGRKRQRSERNAKTQRKSTRFTLEAKKPKEKGTIDSCSEGVGRLTEDNSDKTLSTSRWGKGKKEQILLWRVVRNEKMTLSSQQRLPSAGNDGFSQEQWRSPYPFQSQKCVFFFLLLFACLWCDSPPEKMNTRATGVFVFALKDRSERQETTVRKDEEIEKENTVSFFSLSG